MRGIGGTLALALAAGMAEAQGGHGPLGRLGRFGDRIRAARGAVTPRSQRQ